MLVGLKAPPQPQTDFPGKVTSQFPAPRSSSQAADHAGHRGQAQAQQPFQASPQASRPAEGSHPLSGMLPSSPLPPTTETA